MSEKNEKPTAKRLKEARRRGQIAKSVELTSAVQLATLAMVFFFFAGGWFSEIVDLIGDTLAAVFDADMNALQQRVVACVKLFMRIIGVTGGILVAVTLGIQLAQAGIGISPGAFSNVGQKINPVNNLKQMFSMASVFELCKSILKLCVVGGIFAYLLKDALPNIQHLSRCGAGCALSFTADLLFRLFIALLAAYVFFAMADYAFQKQRITKQLMMSREEIKQEFKDSEGNQEVKQQRKEFHRELQQGDLKSNVRKSSFIIRNPTHVAICMLYDESSCPLPKVLAKATDDAARAVVELAEEAGIPMVENVPLARMLLKAVPAGRFIPPDFYDAMAEVIHFVNALNENCGALRK